LFVPNHGFKLYQVKIGPIANCQTSIPLSGIDDGAIVTLLLNNAHLWTGCAFASSGTVDVPPLKTADVVTATQSFPCAPLENASSDPTSATVTNNLPPAPSIPPIFCLTDPYVVVDHLVRNALVQVLVQGSTQAWSCTPRGRWYRWRGRELVSPGRSCWPMTRL